MHKEAEKNSTPGGARLSRPTPEGLLVRLRSLVPVLNRGPARVGECVLADPAAVVPMTIQQLAAHSKTSDATVTRLAKALGCSGYREFRALLAASIAVQEAVGETERTGRPPADIEVSDAPEAVLAKLVAEERQVLADTAAALDAAALSAAAEAVVAARRVVIVGIGVSGLAARDLSANLERIGVISQAVTEGHAALTVAAAMRADDVLIAFTASGETTDVLEPLAAAQRAQAATIAVTVRPHSSATRADHVLIGVAAREQAMRSSPLSSRTSQLIIGDALFALIFQRCAHTAGDAVTASYHLLAPRRPRQQRP